MARTFRDRTDAGEKLADRVAELELAQPVIFALPRGGLPVAVPVAERLGAPLDILLVRKIGAPGQPELALGAVVNGASPVTVYNRGLLAEFGLTPEDLADSRAREIAEIGRRRAAYGHGDAPAELGACAVVAVDDGLATGATMLAAVRALRARGPASLVLAVPVASTQALERLTPEVDTAVCLSAPLMFRAVGGAYDSFPQVSDDEVRAILAARAARS